MRGRFSGLIPAPESATVTRTSEACFSSGLAVLTDQGAPNQSVMWFDLDLNDRDTILMNTKEGRAKARFLRHNPRVSLCFEDELHWVALQGSVALDDDRERALDDIRALAVRYGDDPDQFDGQQRLTIRLKVDKVIRHE